jgi:hypothetical protein
MKYILLNEKLKIFSNRNIESLLYGSNDNYDELLSEYVIIL